MVPTKDIAWHAGNWYVNMHSVGIENEGFALQGAKWFTNKLYHSLARLTRYQARRFGFALDRAHVIGHDQVPGPTGQRLVGRDTGKHLGDLGVHTLAAQRGHARDQMGPQ